jgi:hypothetical protein
MHRAVYALSKAANARPNQYLQTGFKQPPGFHHSVGRDCRFFFAPVDDVAYSPPPPESIMGSFCEQVIVAEVLSLRMRPTVWARVDSELFHEVSRAECSWGCEEEETIHRVDTSVREGGRFRHA